MADAEASRAAWRKVLLKLDDGRVLGVFDSDAPQLLEPDEAFAKGKVQQADVFRMEELLRGVAARVPGGAPPLRTVDKRPHPSFEDEPLAAPPAQRQRPTPRANGHAYEPASPTAEASQGSWHTGEFEHQCLDILDAIWPEFGTSVIYFDHPVEVNIVPDYPNVIPRENWRDLGTMKTKLQRRRYKQPQDFYDDMRLFFHNIYVYNGEQSQFGILGKRVQAVFEEKWAGTGFAASTRARRTTAGIAKPKYEPDATPPEKRPLPRAPSARSVGTAPAPARPARQAPKRTQSGVSGGTPAAAAPRAKQPARRGPMPRARMEQVAATMQALEGPDLEGIMAIIQDSVEPGADGEVELDFESLDQDTLWKLDEYLQKINKGTGANGTFQLVDDNQSDSEEVSDSESD